MNIKIALTGFLVVILAGCTVTPNISDVQRKNGEVLVETLTNPENVAISKMGCTYEQVQKALNGVPENAPFSDLQKAWGEKSIAELNVLHGLPADATINDLYRAVRIELKNNRVCEKKFNT